MTQKLYSSNYKEYNEGFSILLSYRASHRNGTVILQVQCSVTQAAAKIRIFQLAATPRDHRATFFVFGSTSQNLAQHDEIRDIFLYMVKFKIIIEPFKSIINIKFFYIID